MERAISERARNRQLHTHVETSHSAHGRVLCLPIRHDVSLEAVFALEDVIQHLVVLACEGVVDEICCEIVC